MRARRAPAASAAGQRDERQLTRLRDERARSSPRSRRPPRTCRPSRTGSEPAAQRPGRRERRGRGRSARPSAPSRPGIAGVEAHRRRRRRREEQPVRVDRPTSGSLSAKPEPSARSRARPVGRRRRTRGRPGRPARPGAHRTDLHVTGRARAGAARARTAAARAARRRRVDVPPATSGRRTCPSSASHVVAVSAERRRA